MYQTTRIIKLSLFSLTFVFQNRPADQFPFLSLFHRLQYKNKSLKSVLVNPLTPKSIISKLGSDDTCYPMTGNRKAAVKNSVRSVASAQPNIPVSLAVAMR